MIYRIFTRSREYFLTGSPGLDIKDLYLRFRAELGDDAGVRRGQLLGVLEYNAPDEPPEDDLESQAFVALLRGSFDLLPRGVTEVSLDSG